MQSIASPLRVVGLGLAVAATLASGIVAAAQTGTGLKTPSSVREPDKAEPCCNVTSIDSKAGSITAKVTATGAVFTLDGFSAAALASFKVGSTVDMSCGVSSGSGTTGSVGSAACGSNVPRGADTRPKDCVATSSSGATIRVACPQNVPIKSTK